MSSQAWPRNRWVMGSETSWLAGVSGRDEKSGVSIVIDLGFLVEVDCLMTFQHGTRPT